MNRNLHRFFRSYFVFNHQEKVMVWFFLCLIILLVGTIRFLNSNTIPTTNPVKADFALADSLRALITQNKEKQHAVKKKKETLFFFNPNKAGKEELIQLGFYPKLAERLIKYRAKAPFRKADELKKLYGIDESFVDRLAPFMIFEIEDKVKTEVEIKRKELAKKEQKIPVIHLNNATPEDLMDLKGVGVVLSRNIAEYREKLGGFADIWQLLEVWGVDSSVILKNRENIVLDTENIKPLYINTANFKELVSHPYINGKLASLILNYRQQHGFYHSVEDLSKIKIITPEFLSRIGIYLNFETPENSGNQTE